MFGTTCWTTGAEVMFSTIPRIVQEVVHTDNENDIVLFRNTQTYVGNFHPLVHIQEHRHTEMNQWCSHRQCWLDKCPFDWLLPPNTHQNLCWRHAWLRLTIISIGIYVHKFDINNTPPQLVMSAWSTYPSAHEHSKDPNVFVQVWLQGFVGAHSSLSI